MTDVLTAAVTGTLQPAQDWGVHARPGRDGPSSPDRVRQVLVAVVLWLAVLVGLAALMRHVPACHGTGEHLRQQVSFQG